MKTAAVVFNPLAGRKRLHGLLAQVLAGLRSSGFDATAVPTRGPGDAEVRAREAARSGAEAIFALGGDGTLRECAAGVLGSNAALAFLPTGTMNVMALEFGIAGSAVAASGAYANAHERRLGVGLGNGTPFLMQASAGIDAFLIGSLRAGEKRWLGRAAVIPALIRSLAGYRFPSFEVESETGVHRATLAVAANISRYGGPFELTPQATSDGTSLELFLFSGRGRVAAIKLGVALLLGHHSKLREATHLRIRTARVTAEPGVPFQVDGDVLELPPGRSLEISLAPQTLRVLVPASRNRAS